VIGKAQIECTTWGAYISVAGNIQVMVDELQRQCWLTDSKHEEAFEDMNPSH